MRPWGDGREQPPGLGWPEGVRGLRPRELPASPRPACPGTGPQSPCGGLGGVLGRRRRPGWPQGPLGSKMSLSPSPPAQGCPALQPSTVFGFLPRMLPSPVLHPRAGCGGGCCPDLGSTVRAGGQGCGLAVLQGSEAAMSHRPAGRGGRARPTWAQEAVLLICLSRGLARVGRAPAAHLLGQLLPEGQVSGAPFGLLAAPHPGAREQLQEAWSLLSVPTLRVPGNQGLRHHGPGDELGVSGPPLRSEAADPSQAVKPPAGR